MKKGLIVFLIFYLMTFVQIGTDLYLPSFPAIKSHFSTTATLVKLTFSVFVGCFAVSQLFYGPFVDRFGRKPFLLIGVSLYFIMSLVAATAQSIEVLLVARALQGIGAGACSVIPRAIMRDCFSGDKLQQIMIYQALIWSFIPVTAPLLGSYIQHYLGWRYNFVALSIAAFIALLCIVIYRDTIKKPESALNFTVVMQAYKQIICYLPFFTYLICVVGVISAIAAFNVSAPLIIQQTLHYSSVQYGWSVVAVGLGFLLGLLANRVLLKRYSGDRITLYGLFIVMAAVAVLVVFAFFTRFNLWMLLSPVVLLMWGLAFIFPNSAAKVMQFFPDRAGKAAALLGFATFTGSMLTSVVMSVLPEDSLWPLAIVLIALVIMMALGFVQSQRVAARVP